MSETNISSATYGGLTTTGNSYSVTAISTDAGGDQKEYSYQLIKFNQWLGYYKTIPELKISIDAISKWTIGKGFKSNPITELLLMSIKGHGKDTFNSILENQIRTSKIAGDSFAEIIREDNYLVNIKPLDPSTICIIVDDKGRIKRYEQVSKIMGKTKKFKPNQILHLSNKRIADEVHGISIVEAVENIILSRNEAMADMKQLMHRHVKPIIKFQLDTDDATKIAEFKAKADLASDKGENLFIPKGAVEADILSVPTNSTLNPLPWIQQLNQYFFQAVGVPQIIVGGSQEMTEATAKIAYLAFEQTIEEEQLYIEEQILLQLDLQIELEFPATLQNEMLSDNRKAETTQASTPEDTSVKGVGLNG
jgi:hypothetical protein